MRKFRVTCYGRKVGAIGLHGTDAVVVKVECANEHDARCAAIAAVYVLRSDLEHIMPRSVQEIMGE